MEFLQLTEKAFVFAFAEYKKMSPTDFKLFIKKCYVQCLLGKPLAVTPIRERSFDKEFESCNVCSVLELSARFPVWAISRFAFVRSLAGEFCLFFKNLVSISSKSFLGVQFDTKLKQKINKSKYLFYACAEAQFGPKKRCMVGLFWVKKALQCAHWVTIYAHF